MPRSAPTRTGSTSARAAASAWASARAGMRWPPVPPPASKTLIGAPNAEFGMRNAECHDKCRAPRPSTSIPHSAFRTPHLGDSPPSSDADQDPRGHQRHEQARAAVRDERERDARSEEHTSELQSQSNLVCRLLLEKKKKKHSDTRATVATIKAHI